MRTGFLPLALALCACDAGRLAAADLDPVDTGSPAEEPGAEGDGEGRAPEVRISPSQPHACEPLQCEITSPGSLPGVSEPFQRVRWFRDGELWEGPRRTTLIEGDTIPAEALEDGDEWTCEGYAWDGRTDGRAGRDEVEVSSEARAWQLVEEGPGGPLDVLLVVDDSGSMEEEQALLADKAGVVLEALGDRSSDWHLGVVTTDMDDTTRSGRLVPVGERTFLSHDTPDAASLFESLVTVGTDGSGYEQPRGAVAAALSEPLLSGANAGFLRQAADLHVVFLTDEADVHSGISDAAFEASLRELKPAPGQVRLSAITGPAGGCDTASDGSDHLRLVQRLDGAWASICTPNWSAIWEDLAGRDPRGLFVAAEDLGGPEGLEAVLVAEDSERFRLRSDEWEVDLEAGGVWIRAELRPGEGVQLTWPVSCEVGSEEGAQ